MPLSKSGRIVLIDDEKKEIDPIITTLSTQGIPFIYFDGNMVTLPKKPLKGIRFVFLDVELKGMAGQPDPTKASGVIARLKKIISVNNGPYVIIFWTGHSQVIPLVLSNCKIAKIPPVGYFDLRKPTNTPYDINKINRRLKQKLGKIGAFHLYVEWDNTINEASKEFVRTFSSLVTSGPNWSRDTAALFYNLYKTYVDLDVTQDKDEQFKYACHLMNRSFLDTLENFIRKDLKIPKHFNLENRELPNNSKAKLNTSLFLSKGIISRHSPGNVYTHSDTALKESLIRDYFPNGQIPDECELCMVIISPECDLARNKVMKIKRTEGLLHRLHRVLFGLKIPSGELNKSRRERASDYRIGPIWHDKKSRTLIIHFATIAFHSEGELPVHPMFTLKRDLLFDLQSKAANHVNRLGNYLLKE